MFNIKLETYKSKHEEQALHVGEDGWNKDTEQKVLIRMWGSWTVLTMQVKSVQCLWSLAPPANVYLRVPTWPSAPTWKHIIKLFCENTSDKDSLAPCRVAAAFVMCLSVAAFHSKLVLSHLKCYHYSCVTIALNFSLSRLIKINLFFLWQRRSSDSLAPPNGQARAGRGARSWDSIQTSHGMGKRPDYFARF